MVGQNSVCCTSLDPIINSRRKKVQPMLVVRGGVNGERDPAVVYTTVASGVGGTGLPARVRVYAGSCGVVGGSIVLLRRVHAVSGGELERCIYRVSRRQVGGVSRTVEVDLSLAAWVRPSSLRGGGDIMGSCK